jgi:hypothetical protein
MLVYCWYEIKKYTGGVTSGDMMFIPSFYKNLLTGLKVTGRDKHKNKWT